ncbi:MAG: sigma-70 family RNA polymerase sigma factor, partial [Oscillospiraceae bacterium]|nr:sigma-70 family RNA polymerase sigma factor [Oscillospiraceae bacterium]
MLDKKEYLSNLIIKNQYDVFSFIQNRIYSKSIHDVEDCVQEVFLTATRKIMSMDVESHPKIDGWLFAIAKNIIARFNKKYMKTKNYLDTEADVDTLITDDRDFTHQLIEDIVYGEIDKEEFKETISKELSEDDKRLYRMKLKRLSNKEISVIFNISENAVKQRYKRIKQK